MAERLASGGQREPGSSPKGGNAGARARGNANRQDHAAYDDVRSSQLESSVRLRYLVDSIYVNHGLPPVMQALDGPGRPGAKAHGPQWAHILFSARYLVLELWDFEDTYSAHYEKIVGGLEVESRRGVHMIISGHRGVKDSLKDLRNSVAHAAHDIGEFAGQVDAIGLAPLVHYARAVAMFQDAVFRTIGNRHGRANPTREGIPVSLELPGATDRRAFEAKYGTVDFGAVAAMHDHECEVMRDLQLSLDMLYENFYKAALQSKYRVRDCHFGPDMHVYGAKYMILDIHNFIVELGKLGIGNAMRPGFLARSDMYLDLRNDYAAHTRTSKIRGIGGLLEGRPGLLSDMLMDMVEIDELAQKILERHPDKMTKEITRMTPEQVSEMDRRLRDVQEASHEAYGYRYADRGNGQANTSGPVAGGAGGVA